MGSGGGWHQRPPELPRAKQCAAPGKSGPEGRAGGGRQASKAGPQCCCINTCGVSFPAHSLTATFVSDQAAVQAVMVHLTCLQRLESLKLTAALTPQPPAEACQSPGPPQCSPGQPDGPGHSPAVIKSETTNKECKHGMRVEGFQRYKPFGCSCSVEGQSNLAARVRRGLQEKRGAAQEGDGAIRRDKASPSWHGRTSQAAVQAPARHAGGDESPGAPAARAPWPPPPGAPSAPAQPSPCPPPPCRPPGRRAGKKMGRWVAGVGWQAMGDQDCAAAAVGRAGAAAPSFPPPQKK